MAPIALLYTCVLHVCLDFEPFGLENWEYILGASISGVKTLINN